MLLILASAVKYTEGPSACCLVRQVLYGIKATSMLLTLANAVRLQMRIAGMLPVLTSAVLPHTGANMPFIT